VKKSFDAMFEAEATIKTDLEKLPEAGRSYAGGQVSDYEPEGKTSRGHLLAHHEAKVGQAP
jgi:hypothetical protein